MSKNYKEYKYFANRPDVVKIFDDLDAYLDFCRFELRPYNPADLYRKDSEHYRAFLNSQRHSNGGYHNNHNHQRRDFRHNNKPRNFTRQ
jgi:hypothetical protein